MKEVFGGGYPVDTGTHDREAAPESLSDIKFYLSLFKACYKLIFKLDIFFH